MMSVFVCYRVFLWQTARIDLSNLNEIIVLIDVCFDWISIVRLRVSATHSQHHQSQLFVIVVCEPATYPHPTDCYIEPNEAADFFLLNKMFLFE